MKDITISRRSLLVSAGLLALAPLAGCGGNSGSGSAAAGSDYTIGVLQLTEHSALDAANDGFVKAITCIEMELGEPDASGRRRPVEKKGSEFDLPVDAVIMSLGTSPNPLIKSTTKGLEVNKKGGIIVNEEGLTSRQAVYAGGDAVTGAATVILAMGAGKLGAKSIDEYLSK